MVKKGLINSYEIVIGKFVRTCLVKKKYMGDVRHKFGVIALTHWEQRFQDRIALLNTPKSEVCIDWLDVKITTLHQALIENLSCSLLSFYVSATGPSLMPQADRFHHPFLPVCQDYKTGLGGLNLARGDHSAPRRCDIRQCSKRRMRGRPPGLRSPP